MADPGFWPGGPSRVLTGAGLSPKFAQNMGFSLKITWKLHDLQNRSPGSGLVGEGGVPHNWWQGRRHVQDSITPSRLTAALGLKTAFLQGTHSPGQSKFPDICLIGGNTGVLERSGNNVLFLSRMLRTWDAPSPPWCLSSAQSAWQRRALISVQAALALFFIRHGILGLDNDDNRDNNDDGMFTHTGRSFFSAARPKNSPPPETYLTKCPPVLRDTPRLYSESSCPWSVSVSSSAHSQRPPAIHQYIIDCIHTLHCQKF